MSYIMPSPFDRTPLPGDPWTDNTFTYTTPVFDRLAELRAWLKGYLAAREELSAEDLGRIREELKRFADGC